MTQRLSALLGGLAALLAGLTPAAADDKKEGPGPMWVFVGTYTGKSKGIYRFELGPDGKLSNGEVAAEIANPSFLAVSPDRKHLFAVGELPRGGTVSAFDLDARTGKLTALNSQPSKGAGPCHVSVHPTGKLVFIANYGGGSVAAFPVGADGKLGEATAFVQHAGKSADPARQEGPHGHSINPSPDGRFAVAADLGLDKLFVYKVDVARGTLSANDPPLVEMKPGAGPRHFAFHPNGRFGYAINELDCTMTALAWDAARGAFTKIQTLSTLPGPYQKGYSTAEVVVHPSGKFVYGSNRGQNSIAVFRCDPDTGKLTAAGHQGDGVKTPRNFNIDPSGTFLIVANQDGHDLIVFKIDPQTGALKPTGHRAEVPSPVCVKFVPKAP
jgi:6-phosphogluconolactonase